MLRERILSALIGIPIILFILYNGGLYWIVFFVLLGLGGLYEFNKMASKEYNPPLFLSILFMFILMFYSYNNWFLLTLVLFMFVLVIYLVTVFPKLNITDISLGIFPALYLGFSLSFAILLFNASEAFVVMLAVFLFTWSSDVGGYISGRIWGRHKLAPLLSPNKTWEGSAGGVFLTIITALVFSYLVNLGNNSLLSIIIFGALSSVAAQLGDLFVSSIKRVFSVKDSGNIIPGHGGILDRFDSFFLVLPVVFIWFYYGTF